MRLALVAASLLLASLSIISTVFTLLATTSKSWAVQDYFFDDNFAELGSNETSPVCVYSTSPFYRCGLPRVYANKTCIIPDCKFYPPRGHNKTSCRSAAEFGLNYGDNVAANMLLGMSQQCQQVHYAGNLQIASSVFILLGLFFALPLALLGVFHSSSSTSGTSASTANTRLWRPRRHNREIEKSQESTQAESSTPTRAGSRGTSYITAALMTFLYIGAVLQIFAQFFGVLGLTLNGNPFSGDSRSIGQYSDDTNYFVAGTWAVGKGLSSYATTAWTTAVACAVLASTMFPTPSISRIL